MKKISILIVSLVFSLNSLASYINPGSTVMCIHDENTNNPLIMTYYIKPNDKVAVISSTGTQKIWNYEINLPGKEIVVTEDPLSFFFINYEEKTVRDIFGKKQCI